jgi:hypothetical protein
VADIPDCLVLTRHRDLHGRRHDVWYRRGLIVVLAVLPVLALLNVFGQRPLTSRASSPAASLKIYAPSRLRGGLLYEARFTIVAHRDIKNATLVLDPGWLEGVSLNTLEPSPIGEASRNGRMALELGHIPKGQIHRLFIQFQVNPTNVAWRRPQNVELNDGPTPLLTIHRHVTVYP